MMQQRRMKGMGRYAFLTVVDEIRSEISAGMPIKAAYEKRAEALGISYAQFRRYARKFVDEGAKAGTLPPASIQRTVPTPPAQAPIPAPETPHDSLPPADHEAQFQKVRRREEEPPAERTPEEQAALEERFRRALGARRGEK
jgi:hypothetical protein